MLYILTRIAVNSDMVARRIWSLPRSVLGLDAQLVDCGNWGCDRYVVGGQKLAILCRYY